VVEAPAGADPADLPDWRLDGGPARRFGDVGDIRSDRAELTLVAREEAAPDAVASPRRRPWPVLRRAGTEARDRLMPLRRMASR
jgi:hypothetical protein